MTSQTPDMRAVLKRLERLELQNRRLKRGGALALAAVGAVVLMGQAKPGSRIVEAEKFVVKDTSGKTWASLGLNPDGRPLLLIYGSTEDRKLGDLPAWRPSEAYNVGDLIVPRNSSHIYKCTTAGATGATEPIFPTTSGSTVADGTVVWTDLALTTVTPVMLSSDDLMLSDSTGNSTTLFVGGLILEKVGDGRQPKGQLASLGIADGPTLGLSDSDGFESILGTSESKTLLTGETHKTSAASLVMSDKTGKVIWRAP